MQIRYRLPEEYVPVDLEKLRPSESYAKLMARRTHSIDALVTTFGRIPREFLIERDCPSCGCPERQPELEKDHLALVRCRACDTVYVNPAFDEAHYREIYASDQYQQIVRDLGEASHAYRVERFGEERVKIMAEHLDMPSPRFLDIGCSTGFVVEAARNRGWEASGIDLNPSAVEFGRQRKLDLRVAALEDLTFPPGSFDAVSLFDVIEHVLHPGDVLGRVVELLRPGGIVFLYVPNYDSASRRLMGKDAHFIWPTHHLNYWAPRTFASFVERHGLAVELLVTEGLDMFDYLWREESLGRDDLGGLMRIANELQFFINAGGYGKNLRLLARKPR